MSLGVLPPELYYAILSHIPSECLQVSTLSLSRAIPLAPVPLRPLFEHVRITRQEQLPQLYRRLRYPTRNENSLEESTWVKSFELMTWQVDADILGDVLALLPYLERLNLKLGPVFAPEHLQNMLNKPTTQLVTLNIRFRPYVQTATYYQFLKGSYFDSTLDIISAWPSGCSLSHLSILQDPLPPPPAGALGKSFAQPIVFFSLVPLTNLSLSKIAQGITHLRLRVPSRQLVRFIALPNRYSFPKVTLLDLSTSFIHDMNEIEAMINHIGRGELQHILLDRTGLCNGLVGTGEWEQLGRTCALAGVKHSRDREKALKSWTQAERGDRDDIIVPGNVPAPRTRSGRRGVATATISLRERAAEAVPILPPLLPATTPSGSPRTSKIRIIPSPPRLLSLCANLPPLGDNPFREHVAATHAAFLKGWWDGLGQLRSIWTRLRQSHSNGVRIFRFDVGGRYVSNEDTGMLSGLVEVGNPAVDAWWDSLENINPPILCFSGPRGEEWSSSLDGDWSDHPEGCGHQESWEVWRDNL